MIILKIYVYYIDEYIYNIFNNNNFIYYNKKK